MYGSQWYLKHPNYLNQCQKPWDVSGQPDPDCRGDRYRHSISSRISLRDWLPGFDFVRNQYSADGDGIDADPSDPGDGLSSADLSTPDCPAVAAVVLALIR